MIRYLYNFGITCYKQGVGVAALRSKKARLLHHGQKTVFTYLEQQIDKNQHYVWFHASSLGEFEQGRPLIEALKAARPDQKIILTFFSPSGYEVRKSYDKADAVCYLPFDQPGAVRRFLDIVQPSAAIFIKYEFWANYLKELHRRDIPIYIVSAIFRPTQLFFKPYGTFYRSLLNYFTHLFVQDQLSSQLLQQIGVTPDRITVAGDTRLDRVTQIAATAKTVPLIESFADGSTVLIAGSTWPEDEQILTDYLHSHPKLKLIIAPHEVNEAHLAAIESQLHVPNVRYSAATAEAIKSARCLIIDSFGLLSSIYRYGEIAYIGGGFGAGIHNVPEAAVYGIPVIFGPKYQKFKEAVELTDCKGAFSIDSTAAFETVVDRLLQDEAYKKASGEQAGSYIRRHIGATSLFLERVFGIS